MSWRCAAIAYGPGEDVDAEIEAAVAVLREAGMTVGGLLQRFGARMANGKREMRLRVLPDGGEIALHDDRGRFVQGCILDADALARAAVAFRRAAEARPGLLLASRFGKEEAAGGGMRAEIAEAVLSGLAVLVPVRAASLPAWQAFVGQPAEVLPARREAILSWAGLRGAGAGAGLAEPEGAALGWLG